MKWASIGSIFKRGADDAIQKKRAEVEMPTDDSFKAIDDAARRSHEFELKAKRPGEPDVQEIMKGEHGGAFKKFLRARGLNIEQSLRQGDLLALGTLRVEFLTLVHQTEYVKTLVTPEVVDEVITAGFSSDSANFKLIVDTVNKETLVKIVQDQMLDMAASNPDHFQEFSENLEAATRLKKSSGFETVNKHTEALFARHKISDGKFVELRGMVTNDAIPQEEKLRVLQSQVRSSKILSIWPHRQGTGLFNVVADSYLSYLEKRQEALEEERESLESEYATLRQENIDALPEITRLRNESLLHVDDSDHRSHTDLMLALDAHQIRRNRIDKINDRIRKINDSLEFIEGVKPLTENLSTRKDAESLQKGIQLAERARKQLEERMLSVGTTLRTVMEGSSEIRKVVQRIALGEKPREEAAALTQRQRREKNRSFTDMEPSDSEFQYRFERYVSAEREAGNDAPREKLAAPFREAERKRLVRNYRAKQTNDLPFFGFLSGLIFASPKVGIGGRLEKKKLS